MPSARPGRRRSIGASRATGPDSIEFCPQCGAVRSGALQFCRSCGLDFDATGPLPQAFTTTAPPSNAGQMRNVGMLPSTRYKLLAIWVALLLIGWAGILASNDIAAAYFLGFVWFWVVSIPMSIVVLVWGGIRQAQVDLEYERWLKGQRK